ncbi:MAG: DNA replication/repair protein RecF [Clostridiales bacterium]|nr:DNA replication/repair protein RecF [Clostridiales bacterium]
MIAQKIKFNDFRNIAAADIPLSPGVNVFLGNNAQGKTNALEGIYLLASGKSFRTSHEREMVRFGQPFFEVSLDMKDIRREQNIKFKIYSSESAKRRECIKNGVSISRIADLIGVFRAVLFCPEHLAIVKAGPAERRSFMDIALCQLHPLYLSALQRHNKILTQRNALLKQLADGVGSPELLEIYSEQLARECAQIYRQRLSYIDRLDEYMKRFFDELGEVSIHGETPSLGYKNSIKTAEKLSETDAFNLYFKALTSNTAREIAAGASLYGSHKDDIEIMLDGCEARLYASQGQQRSLALAMKLGEGEISMECSGEYPVFLFDDVLSELDSQRQSFLLSRLGNRQVIMTACNPTPYTGDVNFINVSGGVYTAVGQ